MGPYAIPVARIVVTATAFKAPNVIVKQTRTSYKILFFVLYQLSDERGTFELVTEKIKHQTGYSRKTIYEAIAFLKRVNLLQLVEYRTGRGKHSLYKLNWFKPKTHPKVSPLKLKTIKTHAPHDRPHPMTELISPKNKEQWARTMKAFRELLEKSQLETRQARHCASVLGKHIKGKRKSYALALYRKLEGKLNDLKLPEYVTNLKALCAWFMAVLKNIFKPKPKRKRYADYNEYLKAMIEKEREQILLKRGHREPTAAEAWEKWSEDQKHKPLEWYEN